MAKNAHLTFDERQTIEVSLRDNLKFKENRRNYKKRSFYDFQGSPQPLQDCGKKYLQPMCQQTYMQALR